MSQPPVFRVWQAGSERAHLTDVMLTHRGQKTCPRTSSDFGVSCKFLVEASRGSWGGAGGAVEWEQAWEMEVGAAEVSFSPLPTGRGPPLLASFPTRPGLAKEAEICR